MFESFKAWGLEVWKRRKGAGREEVDGIVERALITSASAGVAGSIAATVTTPVDVVKTRIMLKALEEEKKPGAKEVEGLEGVIKAREKLKREGRARGGGGFRGWKVGKEVWRSEGLKGLFRGGTLRAAWTAVGSGLYLGAYEGGRHWLERRRGEKGRDVF